MELSIGHLTKECAALFASQLTQQKLAFANLPNCNLTLATKFLIIQGTTAPPSLKASIQLLQFPSKITLPNFLGKLTSLPTVLPQLLLG